MGDSHGNHVRAAQILDAALERDKDVATASELLEALAYRAELALRAEDHESARDALARARALTLTDAERRELADTLTALDDLDDRVAWSTLRPSLHAGDELLRVDGLGDEVARAGRTRSSRGRRAWPRR